MADLDLISIIDVETTGLDPTTDEVIELSCILYSLSHNCVLQQVSTLVPVSVDVNPVEHINGISAGVANDLAVYSAEYGLKLCRHIFNSTQAIVAHNAPFDKDFVLRYCSKFDPLTPWIDTMAIPWPRATRQGCNLVELALCYGIPVWQNHRALTDCQLLAHIIQREPRAAELLAKELEPKVWVVASLASKSNEDARTQVKELGFVWEGGDGSAPGCFARQVNINDVGALPKTIGPTVTALDDWLWCFVACTKDDKDIHAMVKNWGFRFNQSEHPMPYKWMRPMPRDTAWWIWESTSLPIQILDAPYRPNSD